MTTQQQGVDGKDLKAIEDYIYSTMNHNPDWRKAEGAYQNILAAHSRPAPSPSPCEENGCTDIEDCDERCGHSRIYSPIQMAEAKKQAAAQARNQTLDEVKALIRKHYPKVTRYTAFEDLYKEVQSLRTEAHK